MATSDGHEIVQNITEGVLATILIIGGIVVGFYGYKLHKAILFLLGFIAGAFLTYFILNNVGIASDSDFLHYSLLIAFVIGICTGCLAIAVYNTSVFIIGAICGMIIAQCLWHLIMGWFPNIAKPHIYNIIIVLLFAVIFGFIAFKFVAVLIKPLTAFIGSYMMMAGSAYFVQKYIVKQDGDNVVDVAQFFEAGNECGTGCYIFLGCWALLFVICLFVQFRVGKDGKVASFGNVADEEVVSDEAQDNLLEDV
eukprot:CAMPEP_0197061586 /NCGR_PEP_ID=MMETSP1384-20130603/137994_1 /TAXON_ID=29189 /ORGANISM="Ammonia sp." /LENGTH=251 /DNA_ID=CAMNT_0042497291 /DNA_START=77 /DNA_END=832 /DNA_ORIENTATION=-